MLQDVLALAGGQVAEVVLRRQLHKPAPTQTALLVGDSEVPEPSCRSSRRLARNVGSSAPWLFLGNQPTSTSRASGFSSVRPPSDHRGRCTSPPTVRCEASHLMLGGLWVVRGGPSPPPLPNSAAPRPAERTALAFPRFLPEHPLPTWWRGLQDGPGTVPASEGPVCPLTTAPPPHTRSLGSPRGL